MSLCSSCDHVRRTGTGRVQPWLWTLVHTQWSCYDMFDQDCFQLNRSQFNIIILISQLTRGRSETGEDSSVRRKYWISGSDRNYPCDDWLQLTLHMSHQTNHRVIAQITVHSNKSDQSNIFKTLRVRRWREGRQDKCCSVCLYWGNSKYMYSLRHGMGTFRNTAIMRRKQ